MPIATISIAANNDDGNTYDTGIEQTGTLIYAGQDDRGSGSKAVNPWLRFLACGIAQKSIINSAYVIFNNFSINGTTVNLIIYFENADSPTQISSYSDYNSRSLTSAVAWSGVTNGTPKNSPELKTILQGVVDRSGFGTSSNIQVLIKDNGSTGDRRAIFASYENSSYTEPQLYIDYSPLGKLVDFANPIVGLFEYMKRRTKLYQELLTKGAILLGNQELKPI